MRCRVAVFVVLAIAWTAATDASWAADCHTPADWAFVPDGSAILAPGARVAVPSRPSDTDAYRPGRVGCSLANRTVRYRSGALLNTSRRTVVVFWWHG